MPEKINNHNSIDWEVLKRFLGIDPSQIKEFHFDCYEILGVPKEAPISEIRNAFRQKSTMIAQQLNAATTAEEKQEFENELNKVNKAYNILRDAYLRKNYDKCLAFLDNAVKTGKEAEAKSEHSSFSKLPISQNLDEVYFNKGLQEMEAENYSKASFFFKKAILENPARSIYYVKMAETQFESSRLEDVKDTLDRAYQLDPNNPQVYILMARYWEAKGKLKQAQEILENGLNVAPGNKMLLKELKEMRIREQKFWKKKIF